MCGRFALKEGRAELSAHFDLDECVDLAPRYNVAPGDDVAAIRQSPDGKRVLGFGHSFFNLGPVNTPMAGGEVLMVLRSNESKFVPGSYVFPGGALDDQDCSPEMEALCRGVDPAQARLRIAALSDRQAQALAAEMDQAPAGASGVLDTVVFVFLVLLVTDILGFTKIFPFTRSIR